MGKKMSSKILFAAVAGIGIVAVTSAINDLILKMAQDESDKVIFSNKYRWKYGDIHYKVQGEGEPLLLIHGTDTGSSNEEWRQNISALSKHYTVYAIDLLGFGYSDRPKMTYTAYMYTLLINDFISNVIKKPTNVVAGGGSSVFTVLSEKFRPDNFKKLMLLCPDGLNMKLPTAQYSIARKILELPILGTSIYYFFSCYNKIASDLINSAFFNTVFVSDDTRLRYYFSHIGGSLNKFVFASGVTKFMNADIKDAIKSIQKPVSVVYGEEAAFNPHSILNLNSNIESRAFPEAKLFPNIEFPRDFNRYCREFFG